MSSPLEFIPIVLPLIDGKTILDVACGRGKWGYLLRTNWYSTKRGSGEKEPDLLVGIDLFLPFLKKVKMHKIYDDVVMCDVSFLPFRSESFEVVLASEILEHIKRDDGIRLLQEIERVSSQTMIVTTPHILRKRGGLKTPEGFNPYEKHITKWTIKDIRRRGYQVIGTGFIFFGLSPILSALFSPISTILPEMSTHLVGWKHKK